MVPGGGANQMVPGEVGGRVGEGRNIFPFCLPRPPTPRPSLSHILPARLLAPPPPPPLPLCFLLQAGSRTLLPAHLGTAPRAAGEGDALAGRTSVTTAAGGEATAAGGAEATGAAAGGAAMGAAAGGAAKEAAAAGEATPGGAAAATGAAAAMVADVSKACAKPHNQLG